jgi:hypothetical protein
MDFDMSTLQDTTPRSLTQRLVLALMPRKWTDSIIRESQEWLMICSECGLKRSVWEAGGIRWKAAGTVTFRAKCATCGRVTTHQLLHRSGEIR